MRPRSSGSSCLLLELALLIPLAVTAPHRHVYESGKRRMASIALTAIVTLANIAALCFLIHFLVTGGSSVHGKQLLLGGAQIWWTNVIVFGALVLGARRRRAARAAP